MFNVVFADISSSRSSTLAPPTGESRWFRPGAALLLAAAAGYDDAAVANSTCVPVWRSGSGETAGLEKNLQSAES